MTIDAIKIWNELKQKDNCLEAVNFFESKKLEPDDVLDRGSVNFDYPHNLQEGEKPFYRSAYYCSSKGYMDMHIKQNQCALKKYIKKSDLVDRKILFVDFGCGPMTAGIVFAEILDKYGIKRDENICYLGIDKSIHMFFLANNIGNEYKLYKSFLMLRFDHINISQIPNSIEIAILCFSYVLAPKTLNDNNTDHSKKNIPKSLAKSWHEIFKKSKFCVKTIAIYQNPKDIHHNPNNNFEVNWRAFVDELNRLGQLDNIRYSSSNMEDCNWGGRRASAMAMITGER